MTEIVPRSRRKRKMVSKIKNVTSQKPCLSQGRSLEVTSAPLFFTASVSASVSQAYENMLESEGENALCRRTCCTWYQLFSSGDYDLSDKPHSGVPFVHDRKAVLDVIDFNPKTDVRRIAAETGASRETARRILYGRERSPIAQVSSATS